MNNRLILVLFLISACEAGSRRLTNGNSHSFAKATYGAYSKTHKNDEPSNVATYKKYVSDTFECDYTWCAGGSWNCHKGNSHDCANTEHIIDVKSPLLRDYPKCANIFGNMITADGTWNQKLGSIASTSYTAARHEKERVYGTEIVSNAESSIKSCIANQYGTRAIRDIINITEDILVDFDDGLLIIPSGSQINCDNCTNSSGEILCDCECEDCAFLAFVIDDESLYVGIFIVLLLGLFFAGLFTGTLTMLCVHFAMTKRIMSKYAKLDEMNVPLNADLLDKKYFLLYFPG